MIAATGLAAAAAAAGRRRVRDAAYCTDDWCSSFCGGMHSHRHTNRAPFVRTDRPPGRPASQADGWTDGQKDKSVRAARGRWAATGSNNNNTTKMKAVAAVTAEKAAILLHTTAGGEAMG